VDGEGSFNTSFRLRNDFVTGWKITPVFNVTQKERTVLDTIKNTLGCGIIRLRKDNVWVYEVTRKEDIYNTIIPFFDRFVLWSHSKRVDLVVC
jgi:intein-encoded DNA endonuclease-like protein